MKRRFQALGFNVSVKLRDGLHRAGHSRFMDAFVLEVIERNNLTFKGRSTNGGLDCFVRARGRRSANESHRALVRRWLAVRPDVVSGRVGPLVDARHAPDYAAGGVPHPALTRSARPPIARVNRTSTSLRGAAVATFGLEDEFPSLAAELRDGLDEAVEPELAAELAGQVAGLRVVDRCRCGDDFCATMYMRRSPRESRSRHRTIDVTMGTGIVHIVLEKRIVCVEVLFRDDVRSKLLRLLP